MNTETDELLTQALRLPPTARAALAASLISSLETDPPDEGVEAAWQVEVGRRAADIDRGTAKTVPWSEVERMMADAGRAPAR
jgi:putative addiction module component (TIGR02574 family)